MNLNIKKKVLSLFHLLYELHQDYYPSSIKKYYKHHLILIIGLPKSGTTWIEKLINEIPKYLQLNNSILRNINGISLLDHSHGINEKMINSAPKNKFSFLKLHTHFEPKYINLIEKNKLRFSIQIRDIRDMLISRYYHVLADKYHWQNKLISNLNFDEGFKQSLKGISWEDKKNVIDYYIDWIDDWLSYHQENNKKCFLLRYEDLNKNVYLTFKSFLKFYNFQFSNIEIENMIMKEKNKQQIINSSKKDFQLNGNYESTFRKGIIGEWRELFNEEIKDIFKEKAGDLLIKSGYEKDKNW